MEENFEIEELTESEVVPALHCGPTHSHMGFSLSDVEELTEPDVVPALHCGPTHSHMGFSLSLDDEDED